MAELEKNLALLKAACDDPKSMLKKYLSEGKQVIGCFAPYTPEQLVCAAGMVPMGLWGGQTEYQLAKSYLPAFACPIMQANMEFGLSGVYKGLSAVIIPAICGEMACAAARPTPRPTMSPTTLLPPPPEMAGPMLPMPSA